MPATICRNPSASHRVISAVSRRVPSTSKAPGGAFSSRSTRMAVQTSPKMKWQSRSFQARWAEVQIREQSPERMLADAGLYDAEGRITGYHPATGAKDYNLLYIDQSQCIRCGACKEVCPVECIDVQKVSAKTVCASSLAGKEGS